MLPPLGNRFPLARSDIRKEPALCARLIAVNGVGTGRRLEPLGLIDAGHDPAACPPDVRSDPGSSSRSEAACFALTGSGSCQVGGYACIRMGHRFATGARFPGAPAPASPPGTASGRRAWKLGQRGVRGSRRDQHVMRRFDFWDGQRSTTSKPPSASMAEHLGRPESSSPRTPTFPVEIGSGVPFSQQPWIPRSVMRLQARTWARCSTQPDLPTLASRSAWTPCPVKPRARMRFDPQPSCSRTARTSGGRCYGRKLNDVRT